MIPSQNLKDGTLCFQWFGRISKDQYKKQVILNLFKKEKTQQKLSTQQRQIQKRTKSSIKLVDEASKEHKLLMIGQHNEGHIQQPHIEIC